MMIKHSILQKELKEALFKEFIAESKDNLVSVYKQMVDMNESACNWGGCWTGLDEGISYRDIEELVNGCYDAKRK